MSDRNLTFGFYVNDPGVSKTLSTRPNKLKRRWTSMCEMGLAVEKLSLPSANIECIGLRVSLPKRKKVMLFTVCRPPQTVMEPFLQDLEN